METEPPSSAHTTNDFGRYKDFQPLGEGGIGKVETCLDPTLTRRVAIKSLHSGLQDDQEQRTRFVREARIMASIEHPNIVPVHELGVREDGSFYFTMKEVRGLPLSEILKKLRIGNKKFQAEWPFSSLLDVFLGICNAVAFAHSKGVVHRDLKPPNVLVGEFGEVIVLDWGLAKRLNGGEVEEGLTPIDPETLQSELGGRTMEGAVHGTPDYMAPEQAAGEVSKHDERTDIYALGGILYEVLTLQGTVQQTRVDEILKEINTSTIIAPRQAVRDVKKPIYPGLVHVPRELDAICMKALAKKREERYPSVADLVHDINRWRNHLPVAVCPDSPFRRFGKWCARHRLLSSSVFTALLVLLVAGTTLGTARHLRHQALMRSGDERRAEGTRLAQENLLPLYQWRQMQGAGVEAEALKAEAVKRQGDAETAYEVASILYSQAVPSYEDMRIRPALREMHMNVIRYALLVEDREMAEKRLDFIRQWSGENFEGSDHPETLEWLHRLAKWADGDDSIPTLSLVILNDEERALLEAAGISLP